MSRDWIEICIVGDTAFSRHLADDPARCVSGLDPEVRELLRADVLIANLECCLCDTPPAGLLERNRLALYSPVSGSIEALRALNVDMVSLANTHTLDCGPEALAGTMEALERAGILHGGAGMDLEQASRLPVVERDGFRVGMLAFGGSTCASADRPGTLPFAAASSRRLIAQSREQCDFLVVYFHEGIEGLNYPTRTTIEDAHRAVEAGADLVVGTHPHTIQGIEHYRGVPIAYSLGNFIMSMLDAKHFGVWHPQTTMSLMGRPFDKDTIRLQIALRCRVYRDRRVEVKAVPLVAEDSGLPRRPHGDDADRIERMLQSLSAAFGHSDDPGWAFRDEVERFDCGRRRGQISLKHVLLNVHRLRWRHLVAGWRLLR